MEQLIKRIKRRYRKIFHKPLVFKDESQLLALGTLLTNQQILIDSSNINQYEFKIFSQFGEDGIIQYLIKNLTITNKTFIEFGVEDFQESNCRFLMMQNNWSGFIMDGSVAMMDKVKRSPWYWHYDLTTKAVFITKENINDLLASSGFENIGILSIDLDGNDYHILNTLDLSKLNPAIIIAEYNSIFCDSRPITVPYEADFVRKQKHYSHLYFGASLAALEYAANKKGYALVTCNLAGNNAFFVKEDLLNDKIFKKTVKEAFVESKFRESRNKYNELSFLGGNQRNELIKGLSVLNVVKNELETI